MGFFVREDGTLDIGGYAMGTTRKWRNVGRNPEVAIVVDDIVRVQPWKVRGIEIRGTAEQVTGPHGYGSVLSEELMRIHPRSIRSWGLGSG